MADIQEKSFGTLSDGTAVQLYTLRNAAGQEIDVTNYGARLVAWRTADAEPLDIVLGYGSAAVYEQDDTSMGGVVGRHANRIAGGRAVIDGQTYQLELNSGSHQQNHIHGGRRGFHDQMWRAEAAVGGLELHYTSPDGEGGYPGTLEVTVRYDLTDDGELKLHYEAVSDKATICNLTNHTYFNLAGYAAGADAVLDTRIQILADTYTWADSESLPDGRILDVAGTPMDLREPMRIGNHIDDDFDELVMGQGYDHNWCIRGQGLRQAACATLPATGLTLTCCTTLPGVQFYTGNFLDGSFVGKNGARYERRGGFCLETQYYPNALANPNFPQPVIKAGDKYEATTIYALAQK